ncbi:hypothetical protein KUCAC02_024270, partial [Chaenocephalus aceratus]
ACRVALGTAANACEPPPHSSTTDPHVPTLVVGGQRLLSPMARVPWERACRARVLMLSDLVKSRLDSIPLQMLSDPFRRCTGILPGA